MCKLCVFKWHSGEVDQRCEQGHWPVPSISPVPASHVDERVIESRSKDLTGSRGGVDRKVKHRARRKLTQVEQEGPSRAPTGISYMDSITYDPKP